MFNNVFEYDQFIEADIPVNIDVIYRRKEREGRKVVM